MSVWSFMQQNSATFWMLLVLLLNLPALVLQVIGLLRTGRGSNARAWASVLEAATRLQAEADGFADWGAPEKLCYVLTRLQALCTELGVVYDEELLIAHLTVRDKALDAADAASCSEEEKRP